MTISERARAGVTDHCPHCGTSLESRKRGKPRSVPQHRRYFAMIRAAHSHWPDTHRFKPFCEDHLRKWLQAKAGHAIVNTVDVRECTAEQSIIAVSAALAGMEDYSFTHAADGKFYIFTSESIEFNTLPHLSACALFDAVADTIEAETGLKVAEIMPPIRERKPAKAETFAQVPL